MKVYREPQWIADNAFGDIRHFKGGEVEPNTEISKDMYDVIIPRHGIPALVAFLSENGYIKPIMDNQSRGEDLKIVHRLIDVIESKVNDKC